MRPALVVHAWPEGLPQALADLRGNAGLVVIGVATPLSAIRPEARQAIRHALQSTVAAFLNEPVTSVTLLSSPGQPVQLQAPGANLHVAISHLPGLSVAAICTCGAVGVDVMATPAQDLPDWAQIARDYLGPQVTAALQKQLAADRPTAFAQAWVSLEARLKCLGLGLTEWTPALAARLNDCRVVPLILPAGVCGALALQPMRQAPLSAN